MTTRRRAQREAPPDTIEDMREDTRLCRLVLFDARTQAWHVIAAGPAWFVIELAARRTEPARVVCLEDGTIVYTFTPIVH